MTAPPDLRATVLQALRRFLPGENVEEMSPDLPLGSGGMGLDSISIVEFLLECENRTGIDTSGLFEEKEMTLGRVFEYLEARAKP